MKFYDKYLTPASENIKQAIIIVFVFILGFIVGYFTGNHENAQHKEVNHVKTSSVQITSYDLYNS